MGKLADIVRKQSPYLRFADEETVTAVYKGFKTVPSSFDPEKETMRYLLGVEMDGEKMTKYWDNGSSGVAMALDVIKEGTLIDITKHVTKSADGKTRSRAEVLPR